LQSKLKEKCFETMNAQSDEHKEYFSQDRVAVDVDIILNMFQNCQVKTCLAKGEVKFCFIYSKRYLNCRAIFEKFEFLSYCSLAMNYNHRVRNYNSNIKSILLITDTASHTNFREYD
jgi:hypothetical protein